MLMDTQDKRQEWERIALEHPEFTRLQISRDLIDVQRSRAWVSVVSYKLTAQYQLDIISHIDLKIAFSKLGEKEQVILLLWINGYSHSKIASMLNYERSTITKRINKAILKMRNYLCRSEI
jgi:DNA-directed RNA polymerase specialized sigma24 family protein